MNIPSITLPQNPIRTLALALLSVALCTAAVAGQTATTRTTRTKLTASPKPTLKGIPRFGEVTPTLYRGGRPSPMGLAALAKLGINIIVDLRGVNATERRQVTKLGMRYVPIPWHCPFPHDKDFVRFLRLLHDNPGKKVFVHCRLGDDRTGMMIASYRMAEQGWTAAQAAREMRAYGFTPLHHLICPCLAGYEEKFPERLKDDPELRALSSAQAKR